MNIQEALRDLNEELEETHVQTERDLREELDMSANRVREVSAIRTEPFLNNFSVFHSYSGLG